MKKTISLLMPLFSSIYSLAQLDSSKVEVAAPSNATTFTYYIDGYYNGDFANKPQNNKTSFTNSSNALKLGMASFKIDKVMGNFGATVDVGVGKRAEEFSYNDKGVATIFKQAFISYAPNSTLKFTAGKWATHVGIELLDAYSNRNYSMSYSFSYGPFFHTGLRADIALGGKSAMMIGVAQPTDFVNSSSPDKIIIAQFSTGTKDDKLKAFLNYQGGKDKSQFDLVVNGVVTSQVGINYDVTLANIAGANWSSNAFYINYDPTSKFGFTWRTEFFDDTKSAVGIGTSIFQNTFSANIHFAKLTLIPELRFDNAKDKIFINNNSHLNPYAGNFLLAAVYKF
jgi:hypothetical protein